MNNGDYNSSDFNSVEIIDLKNRIIKLEADFQGLADTLADLIMLVALMNKRVVYQEEE